MTKATDPSNGYEAIADEYISVRSQSGHALVRAWAKELPMGATVLELGAGHGVPITAALVDAGLVVSAIEASTTMVSAFRTRFPDVELVCESVEDSSFFGRKFDAAVAVGLIFLLSEAAQKRLIAQVAEALNSGGAFLFSAPVETGVWEDVLTQRESVSLGKVAYREALTDAGFRYIGSLTDEAGSHYFAARLP